MIRSRFALIALAAALLAACSSPASTRAAADLSEAQRLALADTIRLLTDSIIGAGGRLDAAALTARFRVSAEAAYGAAGSLVLHPDEMRDNMARGYRALRSQRLEVIEQRVAVLGVDAAATTGWGNFTAVDTAGTTATGVQAFTFVWARDADGWGVVQAHFSAQMGRVVPARRDSTRRR